MNETEFLTAARLVHVMDGVCEGLWGCPFVDTLAHDPPIAAQVNEALIDHVRRTGYVACNAYMARYMAQREHIRAEWVVRCLSQQEPFTAVRLAVIEPSVFRKAFETEDVTELVAALVRSANLAVPQAG